jgi:hypothetical protein
MTKEEIKAKTQSKLQAIQTLATQLQITVSAEEMIDENMIIRKVVYYQDNEKYPVEVPKEVLPTPAVRKEDAEA